MQQIIDIVLPVFCLIGAGYGAGVTGLLKKGTGQALSDYVYTIAVPLMLMRTLATSDVSMANPWGLWFTYFTGVAIVWVAASALMILVFKRGHRVGVSAGVAAGFSNLVLLGIPLVLQAYGEEGLLILFVLIGVHLPIMMITSTFLMEYSLRADGIESGPISIGRIVGNVANNLLKNPIIIGLFAGLILRFSGFQFSGVPERVIGLFAQTAGPLALFALGMTLRHYTVKGDVVPAVLIALLGLIAMPAVVYVLSLHVLGLPVLWVKVLVLAAACPSGVNAYLIASQFKVGEGLAANCIVIATAGSIFSLPIWLAISAQL
ncbi:MAG: AEC family transporter [Pseudomonadota bacterium]